ncbi:MAG: hypothetical protein Tsb002_16060 [Wenzhouxiangellaceae bacterium]
MIRILLSLLCALLLSAAAHADDAELSFFVFKETLPAAGLQLQVDGALAGTTNDNGRVYVKLAAGEHHLVLLEQQTILFERQLLLVDDEVMQVLVNLYADGRPPFVDVETSDPDKALTATDTPVVNADLPPGQLTGMIRSADDQQAIANVRVFVSGTSQEARTDEEGRYSFELPPGTYSLSVLAGSFNTRTIDGIVVQPESRTEQNLELTPAGSELPEFVVIEPYVAGSLASVVEERRDQASVANLLGAEQISKSGDSDAASALRRVTGLTLVDGQFIFVRGLGERYSSTLLNGANVPSPDATRRVVPLDLFPAGIIDSISVLKGFTHQQPGEFGGGTVEIRTKAIPDAPFLNIEVSTGLNDQTTFKDGFTYDGGDRDFLGFDDGSRDFPDLLAAAIDGGEELRPQNPFLPGGFAPEELEAIGESIPNNYDVINKSIAPNSGLAIAGGTRFSLSDDIDAGFLVSVDWSQKYRSRFDEVRRDFNIDGTGQLNIENEQFLDQTQREIGLSIFGTAGLELYQDHKLQFNWMWLRSSLDETRITEGFVEDFNNSARFTQLEWQERELRDYQVLGEHILPWAFNLKIDWLLSEGTAQQDIPFFREYRYDLRADGSSFFSPRNDSNRILWSELEDDSTTWSVDLQLPVSLSDNVSLSLLAGLSRISQSRESQIRRFNFVGSPSNPTIRNNPSLDEILVPEFIGPGQFQLIESTRSTDSYTAERDVDAFHAGIDFVVQDWVRVAAGVRNETFDQTVTTFELFDPDNSPVLAALDSDNLLPSLATTFFLPGDQEIRFGYSKTVTRPDFKELSPAFFTDPVLDREVIGNPDLIDGSITHWDLRWDKYFSPTEYLSVSAFYKEFTNPIEIIVLAGTANIITFQNAEAAENFGFEVEFFKQLDFLGDFWAPFYINTNFAYIESEIQLSEDNQGAQTNDVRALQGQSPYVINIQFGFDDPDLGITTALLYNVSGERISEASTAGRPDVFEQPFHQLDFVYSHRFGDWQAKLKLTNILDDDVEFLQGDQVRRGFKKGRELSLALQWSIF